MKKTIFTVIIAILGIAGIGLLIYDIAIKKQIDTTSVIRTIILLVSCVTALTRIHGPFLGSEARKNYEEAYRDQIQYAFEHDKSHRKRLLRAIGYYNQNQYKNAITILNKLLPVCHDTEDYRAVYLFLANCYEDNGERSRAIETYRILLSKDPTNAGAWSNLGLLLKDEAPDRAEECYRHAIEYNDRNPFAHQNFASLCFQTGRYEEAIHHAERALYLKKNFYQAANTLSLTYAILGDIETSKRYFQIAVTNGADSNRLEQALDSVQKGKFSHPAKPVIRENVLKAFRELFTDTNSLYGLMVPTDYPMRSRLGGNSIGMPPLDRNGKPMRMLCAIYFSEMPPLPDFPDKGLLRIYLEESDDYGYNCDEPNRDRQRYRVLFSESEDDVVGSYTYPPLNADSFYEHFPIFGTTAVRFRHDTSSMTYADHRFRSAMNTYLQRFDSPSFEKLTNDELHYAYENFYFNQSGIGGHPFFWMSDPREEAENAEYDTLLLQLTYYDSDAFKIMIGECGVMNFFIRREDLKRRNFSDVLYYWDCD